jgi:hypothetical protein
MRIESQLKRGPSALTGGLVRMLAGAAVVLAAAALAGQMGNATVKDFRVPEYYDPPNGTQIKTLLQGAEAQPESGGLVFIRELKLQTFTENGEPQLLVEAPHCVFDPAQRAAYSPGKLQARTADGKFHLEGEGFLWRQTNSSLIISNRVRTVIGNAPNRTRKS